MPKQNQIIAVVSGKKTRVQKALTTAHHQLQREALLCGISRTYQPIDEDGERYAPESQRVQLTVANTIHDLIPEMADWMDAVATQEFGNQECAADIKIEDGPLLKDIPVTVLLFIERRLEDLRTFIQGLPVLDPASTWNFDPVSGTWVTPEEVTTRTKKQPKVIVKYDATPEHPAQTELFSEDKVVGNWTTKKFSGAIPAEDKKIYLRRLEYLVEATKKAREDANGMTVENRKIGLFILENIFGDQ